MGMDYDAILDEADFAYRDVPICMKRSLRSQWQEAQAELLKMVEDIEATRGADGRPQVTQSRLAAKETLARRVRELQERMVEHTVTFHVVGMPFPEYNAVLLDHPPREGNMVDRALGYNVATFHPAIVRRSVQSPDLSDDGRWERTVKALSDGDFDALAGAANEVNRRLDDGRVPFSHTAYAETQDLDPTSSSPEG